MQSDQNNHSLFWVITYKGVSGHDLSTMVTYARRFKKRPIVEPSGYTKVPTINLGDCLIIWYLQRFNTAL
jgi:hypothetical protein